RDASECRAAGASIYHLHVRDAEGHPTMNVDVFAAALAAIREATDVVVQFTSGGAVTDMEEARIAPLDLRPEMASLTTGTVNFGDEVFFNPVPLIKRFYRRMRDLGIVPEFEIFEPGMIATASRIAEETGDDHHRHFDFVLGVPGALPASEAALDFLSSQLPPGATWSATGIGRSHFDVARRAITRGGHVRTGFEDVRYLDRGRPAASNAELVMRVVELAREQGRPIGSPERTRALFGLGERPR
ncbi:MAG TPA: 3-keto-5-aminohexanoate cleavage protein, partial [Actinomycetota bacterium]|nr:3-keto-5-aminohexanoate cleavage protein [Actinomycetota bacterium]